jgi:hypothetical protein
VTDKESIAKLEKILKQLEKIASNTGIAVGVKGTKGETRKRSSLSEEDRTRYEKIANIYKRVLGIGYTQATADKTAERFRITLKISPSYYINTERYLSSIKDNIEILKNTLDFNSLKVITEQYLSSIDNKMEVLKSTLDSTSLRNIIDSLNTISSKYFITLYFLTP